MDRYRSLYKENSSISTPSQHSKTNRELQNANRAKKRREIYENIRRISVSPTPKKAIAAEECIDRIKSQNVLEFENKENKKVEEYKPIVECDEPKVIDQTEANKSRIALVATGKGNSEKSTRQEAYLLRFIQWKEAHKLKKQVLEPKKRPFVSSGGPGGNAFGDSARPVTKETSKVKCKEIATFVPKDHNTFKPPAGLKNTLSKMTSAAKSVINNDRKSFYTVVPTPPRNKQKNSINMKKPLVLTKTPVISNSNKTPATTTKAVTKSSNVNGTKVMKIPSAIKNIDTRTPGDGALSNKPSETGPAYSAAFNNPLKKIPLNKNGESVANPISNRVNNVAKFARPQPITRKPIARPKLIGTNSNTNSAKSSTSEKNSTTAGSSGAVGKAHLLQSKRTLAEAKERQNLQCHAKLATSFKSKKVQASTFNRSNAPSKITVKGKTLLGGKRASTATTAFAIAETPTDLLNVNPFEAFVTSTRIKSLSPHTTKMPNISPINNEVGNANAETVTHKNIRAHSSTTAKRALLQNGLKKSPKLQTEQHKFNFIRYSCGRPESDMSGINEQIEVNTVGAKEETVETTAYNQTQQNTILEVQPKKSIHEGKNMKIEKQLDQLETPKSNEEERPVNYISSFVSVSRGKVSARKEREKRDSIYLPSADDSLTILNAVNTDKAEIPKTVATPRSVEARRILEAVRYFRQQLQNEIDRLHALCDQWEKYKQENLLLLQKAGGEDMINVTIGQTKLLTSKKFQQFKGLIDRCEDGARGTAAVDDGSEATKPISDVDLEGFWSMLNLQVDNVEKRFENLTRWKDNNWNDPDDVQEIKQHKPKSKPNLNKVKKSKVPAKASIGLQAMLRKMHAEMRKKKENRDDSAEAGKDMPIILTPTRQRHRRSQSGTPKVGNYADENRRQSTPRCISVVVRDRKSLSAAATVISLPVKSQAISAAAAAQRRLSRIVVESPKSIRACGNELRRSLNGMEKAFGGCNELLRNVLAVSAHKARRRSDTPSFIELPIDSERHAVTRERTPIKTPSPTPAINIGRKSILKTPGTAKGKPKNVIFNEKLSVKKFKFTIEDDEELCESEEQHLQTSTEDQRTYSLRTRKVVLRPSSEFEIPKA